MRTLSKLARFFIICAIVFFVGMVCAIAGIAAGGVNDIEKLADRYDWIQDDPGEVSVTNQAVEDFTSIEATGDADIWVLGKSFYESAAWQEEQELLPKSKLDLLRANEVIVIAGDKVERPEISLDSGTLKIDAGTLDFEGITLNMSDTPWNPKVLICVPDETLASLTASSQVADVNVRGASWKKAKFEMNTGDVTMKEAKSGGLTIDLETGDAELQGEFTGTTRAGSNTGDVEINTVRAKATYALDLKTNTGDITIKEPGADPVEVGGPQAKLTEGSGEDKLIVSVNTGDVDVNFGRGQEEKEL